MTRTLDRDQTIALLAALKPGEPVPLASGDTFHHPQYGPMTVSRLLGWHDMMHIDEDHSIKGIQVYRITAFRQGRKKAERINFLPPTGVP